MSDSRKGRILLEVSSTDEAGGTQTQRFRDLRVD